VEAGEYIAPNKMTFAAFTEDWRTKYAEQADGLSALTLKNYTSLLKNRIVPVFGHLQIGEIKTMHIVSKNPMDGVKKPKVEQEKMQYFDGDEAPLVIEACLKSPRYGACSV
jgi:hypothetical protein